MHLTYRDALRHKALASDETGDPEIEVTPEMMAAGVRNCALMTENLSPPKLPLSRFSDRCFQLIERE
jgi:hypothetical protein